MVDPRRKFWWSAVALLSCVVGLTGASNGEQLHSIGLDVVAAVIIVVAFAVVLVLDRWMPKKPVKSAATEMRPRLSVPQGYSAEPHITSNP